MARQIALLPLLVLALFGAAFVEAEKSCTKEEYLAKFGAPYSVQAGQASFGVDSVRAQVTFDTVCPHAPQGGSSFTVDTIAKDRYDFSAFVLVRGEPSCEGATAEPQPWSGAVVGTAPAGILSQAEDGRAYLACPPDSDYELMILQASVSDVAEEGFKVLTADSASTATMKALTCTDPGSLDNCIVLDDAVKPTPGPKDILVKVKAVALNPVDWKMAVYNFFVESWPAVLGCDAAGTVEAIGSEVTQFKVGDRVAGYNQLGRAHRGTFAEYTLYDEAALHQIPEGVSTEQAASIGVSALTAALGLFDADHVDVEGRITKPVAGSPYALVWGGSTSVGMYAVQFLALSGYQVIATASAKNHDLVTSLGAKYVVDYHDKDVLEQITNLGGGKLALGFDTVSSKTAQLTAAALSGTPSAPAKLGFIAGAPESVPDNVKVFSVNLGIVYSKPSQVESINSFYDGPLAQALTSGRVQPASIRTLAGFEGIVSGLRQLKAGAVSAEKLVVDLSSSTSSSSSS